MIITPIMMYIFNVYIYCILNILLNYLNYLQLSFVIIIKYFLFVLFFGLILMIKLKYKLNNLYLLNLRLYG